MSTSPLSPCAGRTPRRRCSDLLSGTRAVEVPSRCRGRNRAGVSTGRPADGVRSGRYTSRGGQRSGRRLAELWDARPDDFTVRRCGPCRGHAAMPRSPKVPGRLGPGAPLDSSPREAAEGADPPTAEDHLTLWAARRDPVKNRPTAPPARHSRAGEGGPRPDRDPRIAQAEPSRVDQIDKDRGDGRRPRTGEATLFERLIRRRSPGSGPNGR